MKPKKQFFKFNSQHGGMLLELMLSVAIAAILIPFVFRYQKTTAERAQNVSIVKQMDVVQRALERCITENQDVFFNHSGPHIFANTSDPCMTLDSLVPFGLDENFAKDFKDDYVMRVLKSQDNNGAATLQGVVLLTDNTNMTTLRTREIVNIGVGKIGFIDADKKVYGGYNSFDVGANNFGLNDYKNGIVKTTAIMRGNTKYLWRIRADGETGNINATMKSPLNLGNQDIVNVGKLSADTGVFYDVNIDKITVDGTLKFFTRAYFPNELSLSGYNIKVGGMSSDANMYLDNGVLQMSGSLKIMNQGNFSDLITADLTKTGNTNTVFATAANNTISGTNFHSDDLTVGSVTTNDAEGTYTETSTFSVNKIFVTKHFPDYYWNGTDRSQIYNDKTYYMGAYLKGINIALFDKIIVNKRGTGYLQEIFKAEETDLCGTVDSNGTCTKKPKMQKVNCIIGCSVENGKNICPCLSAVSKMGNYLEAVNAAGASYQPDIVELLRVLQDIKDQVYKRYLELEGAAREPSGTGGNNGGGGGTGSGIGSANGSNERTDEGSGGSSGRENGGDDTISDKEKGGF